MLYMLLSFFHFKNNKETVLKVKLRLYAYFGMNDNFIMRWAN